MGVDVPNMRGGKADQDLLASLRLEVAKRLAVEEPADHLRCDACKEISTNATAFCPFCGDAGQDNAPAPDEGDDDDEVEVVDESDDDDTDTADDSDDDESDDASDAGGSDDESDDDAGDSDSDSDSDEEEDDGDAKPQEAPAVGIAAKGAKLAKNVDAGMAAVAKELDEAIARIEALKRSTYGITYDLGLELRSIRDKQLFKARGYGSFKKFADKELPITRETALTLVTIVEKNSREDYEQVGFSKLRALAPVNDVETREKLLAKARKGATRAELTEEVAEASGKPRKVKEAKAAASAAPSPEKAEKITLLAKVGAKRQVLRLRDAASGDVINAAGGFQAKGLNPNVYGETELSEGLFLRVGMKLNDKNEMEAFTVRFVRAKSADAE